MDWAPFVIKEIIAAFRQQHSLQDSEKLKNIVREVMAENISREQNQLLCQIMGKLNQESASSREVDKTALERDKLKEECEKLTKEMERLMQQDRQKNKKQESMKELSLKQKVLLERVNELKETNAGKQRSRSRQRNPDNNGRFATNQSQGQQQGQSHSRGAISKFKHQGMKEKANPSFSGNANVGSRVYHASHHPPSPLINTKNTYGLPGPNPTVSSFPEYQRVGQQRYQGPGGDQPQYQGPGGGHQLQYQGPGGGQLQYQGSRGGHHQYVHCNPQGFLQYQQNPQFYQQKSEISQPYSPNPGQQHQPQFANTETTVQHQQYQHKRQFNKGRQSQNRGKYQQRGQSQQRGQFPHQEGFQQQRDNFQPKDRSHIIKDELRQFTAEELNLLKDILKQKKQQGQEEENKDAEPKSQMKSGFKKKQKKRQVKTPLNKGEDSTEEPQVNDSNDSDNEDLDEMKKQSHGASKAQLEVKESKKNMAVQDAQSDAAANESTTQNSTRTHEAQENKEEASGETPTAFNLCVASGVDISQLQEGPEWDAILSNMVLVAKSGGQPAICQPKTLKEMGEFKKKYPNAEVLVLK